MKIREYILSGLALCIVAFGCSQNAEQKAQLNEAEPLYMSIIPEAEGGYSLVSVSPFDGSSDTLRVRKPRRRLIVMSTSHVGFLSAIGGDPAIVGVSGSEYVCDSSVAKRIEERTVADIGFDASPDYERIMELKPDLLLAYSVSPVKSRFLSKVESLGIKTFIVNEHLERHPLARAAYVRLFGALTGNMPAADSVLKVVSDNYGRLRDSVQLSLKEKNARNQGNESGNDNRRRILVNIPYKDQWFIPGQENYLSHLFEDAGGEILGAEAGSSISGQISIERAYALSKEADLWMNVGWCLTENQLLSVNPLFGDFLGNIKANASARGFDENNVVWNDNKRLNAKGGNDFWESGVVRPDLLLLDLVGIFSGDSTTTSEYYRQIL